MKDDFEKMIDRAAESYRTPPETPRGEIWARVREQRRPRRRRIALPARAPRWLWIPAAAAAAVIVGIAIGRLSVAPPNGEPVLTEDLAPAESLPQRSMPGPRGEDLHRLAAREHFARTEVLLTAFRSSRGNGDLASWAQELLVETRLLMDSPASRDAEVRALLRDLELVLAQIVQTRDDRRTGERKWITEGLDERAVLVRLRMQAPPRLRGV